MIASARLRAASCIKIAGERARTGCHGLAEAYLYVRLPGSRACPPAHTGVFHAPAVPLQVIFSAVCLSLHGPSMPILCADPV